MRALCLALTLALAPLGAQAQSTAELAQEYADLPAVQEMMSAMFSPEASAQQLAATLPPGMTLTDEQMSEIGVIISEELIDFQPRLETLMVEAMAETFTEEEIQAMIDFYSTEIGASILIQTQPMFTNIMTQLGPEMQQRMMGRQADIMAIITGQ
ncbi:DUF2059 domain-containing protein [Gymnodinialimonas sp. 2305UL16-5]|uniref:DUF2059 domain-containing protein n=1 Tax=Gymnodinialimonas mytili TaxID=3126503 RepID=UPI00309CEFD5